MHADAAEQGDVLVPHTGRGQLRQQRWHQQMIWASAGDVGEDNAGGIARPGQFPQRRRVHRLGQRFGNGRLHVRDGWHLFRFDHRAAHTWE
jgi:hypothetical protein